MSRGTVTASTRGVRRSLSLLWTVLFIASILLQYATFSAPAAALAADTPFKAPGATAAPNEWDNPSNALANDGVNANADADDEDQGFVNFGFSLPAGSIVDGITVQAEAITSDPGCQLQARVSWNNGTSFSGYQTANLTSTLTVYNLGGATNTWGRTWDPTELVDGKFKVEIRANDPDSSCTIAADGVQVDYVAARVSYRTINDGTNNAALSGTVCDAADFNFAIDMSGSIGAQGDIPSNLADLKAGITEFVAAFQNAGGDGRYSGSRFNDGGASALTSGYQSAATFTTAVNGLSGPTGLTPTQAGINTARGNNANDRAGVPNILFVVTDGSPNVPNTHGDDLTVPETWLQGANGAITAADAARAGSGANQYVVKAVYLSTAGDPGDTNLPFSPAGDSQWAQAVMTEIGGGSFLPADFESFVDDLFKAIGCAPPSVVISKTADAAAVSAGGQIGFTVSVNNQGGRAANDVTVTDNLPGAAGLNWSINPAAAGCSISGAAGSQVLTCNFGTLAAGASKSVHVVSGTTPASCGTVNNSASFTTSNDGSGTANASVAVNCPNVTVAKTPDGGNIAAGSPAVFSIVVSNAGPGQATGVTLTDSLPVGFTWTLGGPDAASCSINTAPNPDVLSCAFGTVNSGQSRTITLTAPTAADLCAVIPNTAVVDATNEPDTANYTGNNTDGGSIAVHCPGTITITKVAHPADGTDFSFTTTGAGLSSFLLDDDANATLPNTRQFTVPAGAYSVAEVLGPNWDLVSITCSSSQGSSAQTNVGAGSVAITLADGGAVSCTYTNVKAGHIIVQKQTDPDGSQQQFTFDPSWGANFDLADNGSADSGPLAANLDYSVAEILPDGWIQSSATCNDDDGNSPASIHLDPGETVTCVFTNTQKGRIVTDKVTIPAGSNQAFGFDPSWGPDFGLTDAAAPNNSGYLTPGQYSVAENAVAGWHLVSASCTSNQGDAAQLPSAITLDAGEVVTCTFTNEQQGRIIVAKETLPDGASQPFHFNRSFGTGFILADGQQNDSGYLNPGTYGVSEVEAPGWKLTNVSCSDQSNPAAISLAPGEVVTCTFENTQLGRIIVEKQTSPNGAAGSFSFSGDAAGSIGDGGSISVSDLMPGTYTSTEGNPGEAWDLGAIVCDDGQSDTPSTADVEARTATFEVDPGETVTCVFTNVQHGTITIIKDADPADGTDFSFDAGNLGSFVLDDDDNATNSDTKTFVNVKAGTYQVSEKSTEGWDLTSIDCNGSDEGSGGSADGATATIRLADGGSVTCVFTNKAPSIDVVKTAGDAADGASYTTLAGNVTYTYEVTNDGPLALAGITVTDDNGTPGTGDDFAADCPKTTLDPGESMTCSATVAVSEDRTNVAVAHGHSVAGTPAEDDDDATVVIRKPGIDLDKVADDEDGFVDDGQVVTFTITGTVDQGPVTDAVITDTLPVGQTYVAGSQSANPAAASFTVSPDGRTLTWTFASLASGDPAVTVSYDVTIDESAVGPLENTAELCVAEIEGCASDDETVTPEPAFEAIVRTPVCDGDVPYLSYDVSVFGTDADSLTMTWINPDGDDVVYSGLPLSGKVLWPGAVVDGEGHPVDWPGWKLVDGVWVQGDEFDWVRPSVQVLFQVNPEATVSVAYPPASPVCNSNPPTPELGIEKSNDAPLTTIDLGDGTSVDVPYLEEGDTVTYTLDYTVSADSGVSNAVITDVLPLGLTYVDGSATSDDQFTFVGYDDATRTLRWEAATVTVNGSVSYEATADVDSAELTQPLKNVATISSDQTEPVSDESDVYTGSVPLDLTPPPTDTVGAGVAGTDSGPGLLLTLLALAGLALGIGVLTPARVVARKENRRR